MPRLRALLGICVAAVIAMSIGLGAAQAGGSIGLDEVMEQLKHDSKLISDINAELKKQNLKAGDVVCIGSRFGNQWTHLGGARSIPYECDIGSRKLSIDGELHLYDKAGKELDLDGAATPDKAVSYKQTNLKWTWS